MSTGKKNPEMHLLDDALRADLLRFGRDHERATERLKKRSDTLHDRLRRAGAYQDLDKLYEAIGLLPSCYLRFNLYEGVFEIIKKDDAEERDTRKGDDAHVETAPHA